jgi:hypothetical protein
VLSALPLTLDLLPLLCSNRESMPRAVEGGRKVPSLKADLIVMNSLNLLSFLASWTSH